MRVRKVLEQEDILDNDMIVFCESNSAQRVDFGDSSALTPDPSLVF